MDNFEQQGINSIACILAWHLDIRLKVNLCMINCSRIWNIDTDSNKLTWKMIPFGVLHSSKQNACLYWETIKAGCLPVLHSWHWSSNLVIYVEAMMGMGNSSSCTESSLSSQGSCILQCTSSGSLVQSQGEGCAGRIDMHQEWCMLNLICWPWYWKSYHMFGMLLSRTCQGMLVWYHCMHVHFAPA